MRHDNKAPGRDEYARGTTVGEQRGASVHVHDGVAEQDVVAMREASDATFSTPKLLLPSIQVNVRVGRFPPAEANGCATLIPVTPKAPAALGEVGAAS